MRLFNWRSLAIACCLVALAAAVVPTAYATIVVTEMTATALNNGTIEVRWVTGTELDTTAFQLYRSLSATYPSPSWSAIGVPTAALGDGSTYTYIDDDGLTPGTTYCYLVEGIAPDNTRTRYPQFIRCATAKWPFRTYLPLVMSSQ